MSLVLTCRDFYLWLKLINYSYLNVMKSAFFDQKFLEAKRYNNIWIRLDKPKVNNDQNNNKPL